MKRHTRLNTAPEIADKIAKANGLTVKKLGLRFDRVVMRLFEDLTVFGEEFVPDGQIILLSVTAPIRLPAKTAQKIEEKIKIVLLSNVYDGENKVTFFGNKVRIRSILANSKHTPRIIPFVHNPDTSSKFLLNFAEKWVLGEN